MRRQRRQRGAVLLEFALTLPVLLFLLLAGADLLWFEQQAVTLSYVATQAAVCQAQAVPACNPSAWAKTVAAGLLLDPSAMEVTTDAAMKSVTIRYDARALTGFLKPMVMTRTAVTP
jgi:Flp pilus assembly protein TadG